MTRARPFNPLADGSRLGAGPLQRAPRPARSDGTQVVASAATAIPAARGLRGNGREAETEGKFYAQ